MVFGLTLVFRPVKSLGERGSPHSMVTCTNVQTSGVLACSPAAGLHGVLGVVSSHG
jgi:hypothetical protein